MGSTPATDVLAVLRRLLFALVALGTAGLMVELFLLEHYEEWQQWLPLGALGVGVVTLAALLVRPGPATLRAFRLVMAAFVALGVIGIALHFTGNIEFEQETNPGLSGGLLLWESLRGATPAFAPGSLAQLGLLGLVATWRHPAERRVSARV